MAKRLGLRSYAYCWRIARQYRAGQMPMLPSNERELLAFRDFLAADCKPSLPITKPATQFAAIGGYDPFSHSHGCGCAGCRAKEEIAALISSLTL
jgi:hypothetical protein